MLDGALYEVIRDRAAESRALTELAALGFASVHELVPVYYQHAHTDDFALREIGAHLSWMQVVTQEIPRLRRAGWTVEVDADFPVQVLTTDTEIEAELVEGSGIDWLELHLGVTVDGEQRRSGARPGQADRAVREAAALAEAATTTSRSSLPLPDGRMLSLPLPRIRPTLTALLELLSAAASIRTMRHDRLFPAGCRRSGGVGGERTGLVWRGGESLRELGRLLREAGGDSKADIPDAFTATLRPYQSQGVDWLQFLRAAGLGGVLADDMGLGKTVQTLAHLLIEKAAGRLDRAVAGRLPDQRGAELARRGRAFRARPESAGAARRQRARHRFGKIAEARPGAVHLSAADPRP